MQKHETIIYKSGDFSCQRAVEKKNQDKDSPVPASYLQQSSRIDTYGKAQEQLVQFTTQSLL